MALVACWLHKAIMVGVARAGARAQPRIRARTLVEQAENGQRPAVGLEPWGLFLCMATGPTATESWESKNLLPLHAVRTQSNKKAFDNMGAPQGRAMRLAGEDWTQQKG